MQTLCALQIFVSYRIVSYALSVQCGMYNNNNNNNNNNNRICIAQVCQMTSEALEMLVSINQQVVFCCLVYLVKSSVTGLALAKLQH